MTRPDWPARFPKLGVELLSTGGTFQALSAAGIPVQTVESYTGSPEVMDGRVKTLHPRVHGALLARAGTDDADLERIGAKPIDLVVVNLYPSKSTLAKPGTFSSKKLIENIDIGGPSMLRSAAKNHDRVTVVCDPNDYALILEELARDGDVGRLTKERLAAKVFAHTAAYDAAISGWLSARGEADGYPRFYSMVLEKAYPLRYGENPHQTGAFYKERKAPIGSLGRTESVGSGSKELSFNNLVDVEAALDAVREFENPAVVVQAHQPVRCRDPHRRWPADTAPPATPTRWPSAASSPSTARSTTPQRRSWPKTFLEASSSLRASPTARYERLRAKQALRLLTTGGWLGSRHQAARQFKRVGGGFVIQQRDATGAGEVLKGRVVTDRQPTAAELSSLDFAWMVCKHVKSNAIVLAAPGKSPGIYETIGIGGGQTARVTAVQVACDKAGERAKGSVLASDAFFPFPDGVKAAAAAGVAAIAQPGGSKKDDDVIRAANEAGIAMIFTGVRHFRH